jgi:hypothetical protein
MSRWIMSFFLPECTESAFSRQDSRSAAECQQHVAFLFVYKTYTGQLQYVSAVVIRPIYMGRTSHNRLYDTADHPVFRGVVNLWVQVDNRATQYCELMLQPHIDVKSS